MSEEQQTHGENIILKELSDIKASLAVNTNETANIKNNMAEIKSDIKEIKNDFVNRREFSEALRDISNQIKPLRLFMYGIISIVGLALIGAFVQLVLRCSITTCVK